MSLVDFKTINSPLLYLIGMTSRGALNFSLICFVQVAIVSIVSEWIIMADSVPFEKILCIRFPSNQGNGSLAAKIKEKNHSDISCNVSGI